MSGRFRLASAVAATAVALLATPAFADADRACTRELIGRAAIAAPLQATLDAIFDRVAAPSVETENGVTAEFETMEVLIVRIENGKPVVACVDTKEAAERFLTAPLAPAAAKAAEEK